MNIMNMITYFTLQVASSISDLKVFDHVIQKRTKTCFFIMISFLQDRAALMSMILEDESKRRKLNGITHPKIFRRMLWEIAGYACLGHNYAVLDVPLLYESSGHMINWLHSVLVVTCERDLQMQRLMEARKMTERESGLLIDAQMSLDQKAALADFVIENSSNFQDLKAQIVEIHAALSESKLHWKIRMGIGLAIGSIFGIVFAIKKLIS